MYNFKGVRVVGGIRCHFAQGSFEIQIRNSWPDVNNDGLKKLNPTCLALSYEKKKKKEKRSK